MKLIVIATESLGDHKHDSELVPHLWTEPLNIGAEYREMDSDRIYRAVMMAAENLNSFRWEDSYQRYAFAEQLSYLYQITTLLICNILINEKHFLSHQK